MRARSVSLAVLAAIFTAGIVHADPIQFNSPTGGTRHTVTSSDPLPSKPNVVPGITATSFTSGSLTLGSALNATQSYTITATPPTGLPSTEIPRLMTAWVYIPGTIPSGTIKADLVCTSPDGHTYSGIASAPFAIGAKDAKNDYMMWGPVSRDIGACFHGGPVSINLTVTSALANQMPFIFNGKLIWESVPNP